MNHKGKKHTQPETQDNQKTKDKMAILGSHINNHLKCK